MGEKNVQTNFYTEDFDRWSLIFKSRGMKLILSTNFQYDWMITSFPKGTTVVQISWWSTTLKDAED